MWLLEAGSWRLVAGPPAAAPEAPRDAGVRSAAFVAVPGVDGWFIEIAAPEDTLGPAVPSHLLQIIASVIRSGQSISSLTGELASRYEEIDLLYSIGEWLGHSEAVEVVANRIVRGIAAVVGARRAGLRVFEPENGHLKLVAVVGGEDDTIPDTVPIDAPDQVVVARAFRTQRVETGIQPKWTGGEVLAVPIAYAASGQPSRVIGTLALAERAGGGAFTREETRLLAAIATQIGAGLENARLVSRERERDRLAHELALAHDLQVKLMPTPAVLQGEAEVAVHSVPAESLGGDFHTFARLGRDRIGVMIGDVSSHGFSAALIAAQVMAAAGIHASATVVPDETLELLRDSLANELESTEMYLSLFYGVFDSKSGRLTYSNAGHPYAFRVPRFGSVERLATTAPPLGLAGKAPFGRQVQPWAFAQDLLVLCTDGLTDAPGPDGTRYGAERLIERLGAGRELAPEGMVAWVLDDLREFGASPDDDVTLLVIRV